jgi:AAA15 family ATPase/GTPase
MKKRSLLIKNFKSIKDEVLELNHVGSMDESMGGVITLIGPNNSGKSNILEALLSVTNNGFNFDDYREEAGVSNADMTELAISMTVDNENSKLLKKKDSISINGVVIDQVEKINIATFKEPNKFYSSVNLNGNEADSLIFLLFNLNFYIQNITKGPNLTDLEKDFIQTLEVMFQELQKYPFNYQNAFVTFSSFIKTNLHKGIFPEQFAKTHERALQMFVQFPAVNGLNLRLFRTFNNYKDSIFGENNFTTEDWIPHKNQSLINIEKYKKNHALFPKIMKYDESVSFASQDLMMNATSGLQGSTFLNLVFSLLKNTSIKDLETVYMNFFNQGNQNKASLNNYKKKVNEELLKLSKQFTSIYRVNSHQYRFEIELESTHVFFNIYEGDESINLDRQSTGFKWFFNFFFRIYSNSMLQPGDIIIMDEPATHLHVSGQIQLLKFIREFAIRNEILFVISTHSPFLIDIDYLEEVRLISKNEKGTHIFNKFSATKELENGMASSDLTAPIRSALTIDSNVLIRKNQSVVFVEGITDYAIFIAMRNKVAKRNDSVSHLKFIPIDGVKDEKKNIKRNIVDVISQISSQPKILVDGDKAGEEFARLNASGLVEIHTIREFEGGSLELEDLFTVEERTVLNLKDKKSPYAIRIKNNPSLLDKLSNQTLDKFLNIFSILLK